MRRTTSSHGWLLCYAINLFLNFEWALLSLLLWGLHRWLKLPVLFAWMGLAVWLAVAFFVTSMIGLSASSAAEPTPERENRNPYSAKNADLFGGGKKPEEEDDFDLWTEYLDYLWEAMRLIGVSEPLFVELVRQASAGERDPEYDPAAGPPSLENKMYYFLDGLCDMEYITYQDHANLVEDVADTLTRSAAQQDLPPIPEGLLDPHPMMPDPHSPTGRSEMLGGMAAVYIAGKVKDWRVFAIDSGSDGLYLGVVSHANAGAFLSRISMFFLELGSIYCAHLMDEDEDVSELV